MNFTKTIFALAIGSVGIMGAMSATAATLGNGDTLSIDEVAACAQTVGYELMCGLANRVPVEVSL